MSYKPVNSLRGQVDATGSKYGGGEYFPVVDHMYSRMEHADQDLANKQMKAVHARCLVGVQEVNR
jgi:hypothetical protein